MDIEEFLEKVESAKTDVMTGQIPRIRFIAEEQGRFRYFSNLGSCYAEGRPVQHRVEVCTTLIKAITTAHQCTDKGRYDENFGQPNPLYQRGLPLIAALDLSRYNLKGEVVLESDTEIIDSKVLNSDLLVIFDEDTDYLKNIIGSSSYYNILCQSRDVSNHEFKYRKDRPI